MPGSSLFTYSYDNDGRAAESFSGYANLPAGLDLRSYPISISCCRYRKFTPP